MQQRAIYRRAIYRGEQEPYHSRIVPDQLSASVSLSDLRDGEMDGERVLLAV